MKKSGNESNVLQAARAIDQEKHSLKQIMNVLDNDKKNVLLDEMDIPESEEEILKYLERAQLENQPTEILVQLAEKLKDRRSKLYPEEQFMKNVNDGAMGGMGDNDDIDIDTDRKLDKSEEPSILQPGIASK